MFFHPESNVPLISSFAGRLRLALVGLMLACSGCALGPQSDNTDARTVELGSVPFFSQAEDQRGLAALAMVIAFQGVRIAPSDLASKLPVSDSKQTLQDELAAATRQYGLVPYVLDSSHGDMDIVREVQAGNPVLILQDIDGPIFVDSQWRFAVVVGVDTARQTFTLRSGTSERLIVGYGKLAWQTRNEWAMVAVKPGTIPATADPSGLIAAAEPLEKLGNVESAGRAYKSATEHWPDSYLAWEALAHSRYLQRDLQGSSAALITVLKLAPNENIARNNLAQVLLERYCTAQAEDQVNLALRGESDPARVAIYRQTLNDIRNFSGPSIICPGI